MGGFSEYSPLTAELALARLGTSKTGLSAAEAEERLRLHGKNELKEPGATWQQILFRQFKSSFVYLLFAAAGLAFLLGERIDGAVIIFFVALNAGLGFYQEYHSERAVRLLQKYLAVNTLVRRDGGEKTLASTELVPGDIIIVEAGDLISADALLLEAQDFTVNESALTGESLPVPKDHAVPAVAATELYQARNVVFSGTAAATGIATAVVFGTARDTAIGGVAQLTSAVKRESAFEKGLSRFSSLIARITLGTLVLIVAANIFVKRGDVGVGELIVFAIALGVSVIPEGLPVVTAFSLSRGALHLAKRQVVVKRLSAIEDLGGIEVLCTDKTGTITENKMTVKETFPQSDTVLRYAALCLSRPENGSESESTFDRAIADALSADMRAKMRSVKKIGEIPFDPERKRNSVLVEADGVTELVIKGAPESIQAVCNMPYTADSEAWIKEQGLLGRRVLAVARKSGITNPEYAQSDEEAGCEYVGFVSFADPVKPSTLQALEDAAGLGLAIKMLTGDSPEVAGAVAREAGLLGEKENVLTGSALDALSVEEQHEAIRTHKVFARVSPEQKHRIVQVLQETQSVAFLGDGINDAPALKTANVGLVVQGATDIAREAADIILLEPSLEVIVNGIREGRSVFVNTMKYIKATLSSNFGNFYAVAFGSLLINFLPMLPLQLLLLNLLSDSPMIAVAADRVDPSELRKPQVYHPKEIVLFAVTLGIVSTAFDFLYFGLFYKEAPTVLQTNWFIASIITELLFLFSVRTKRFFFKVAPPAPVIMLLTGLAAVITLALPYTLVGQQVFHFTPPAPSEMGLILAIAVIYLAMTEGAKLLYYKWGDSLYT